MSVDEQTPDEQNPNERRPEAPAADFLRLLEHLKASRGFDFSGYKVSSLMRRMQKRMQHVGIASYSDYVEYLEVHQDEFSPLFNTILINVTSFFRDPQAWQVVAEQILPRILEGKETNEPVRFWSAGCASGEEPYTLAMLLAEGMGDQQFRHRVKIYATDVDDEALAQARQGAYTPAQVEGISPERLERYFDRSGERYVFRPDLRRSLIFGRHDLMQDAAISRIDLLICRNTMMYFNSETQAKILARFHFALNRSGYLFLGKAETLLSHSNSFRPEDLKSRLFQRTPSASLRDRLLALSPASNPSESMNRGARHLRVREAAYDISPVAQIAVDSQGHLLLASEKARRLFNIAPTDFGRLLQDLEISYRPVELRTHLETAFFSQVTVTLPDIDWRPVGGDSRTLEIQIHPLLDAGGTLLGASISFLDHTLPRQLRTDLERANHEVETAYEELQSANEELETTNEELQSTIEELETTNEELQSANEELETMNEELQSTNEELHSVNDQMQERSEELDQVNTHLHAVLSGLRSAVVVLNPRLEVEVWSEKARDLWGLRVDEVQGKPFFSLDIGLPVEQLRGPIRDCLDGGPDGNQVRVDGINRRGRPMTCRIICTRLGNNGGPAGVILLMDDEDAREPAGARD